MGDPTDIAAGQVLIERGQHGSGLYVLLEGTVIVEAEEGTRELGPGCVIGERALLSEDGTRTARVRAKSDVRLIAVDRIAFEQLCARDAELASRIGDLARSSRARLGLHELVEARRGADRGAQCSPRREHERQRSEDGDRRARRRGPSRRPATSGPSGAIRSEIVLRTDSERPSNRSGVIAMR